MKILLFGGTTEGRELTAALTKQGHTVTVCVATPLGAEELGSMPRATVRTGRIPPEEIRRLLAACDLCVDATHPYAEQISRSVKAACEDCRVPLRRVLRESAAREDLLTFPTQTAAADFLAAQNGRILLTTGAKELSSYREIAPERLFARVLPTLEGITACENAGLAHKNIIAMQGPFSTELNAALIRQFEIRWLVTKDGGLAGGFPEKLEAAEQTGATVILIARPAEEGISPEELLQETAGA